MNERGRFRDNTFLERLRTTKDSSRCHQHYHRYQHYYRYPKRELWLRAVPTPESLNDRGERFTQPTPSDVWHGAMTTPNPS